MAAAQPEGSREKSLSHSGSFPYIRPNMTDELQPLKHSSSYQLLPPDMSELTVVLLGNSSSERSSVGSFILDSYLDTNLSTEEEADFKKVRGKEKDKDIVVINAPDLLLPNMSENKLRENVETCVRVSAPGPHVFLLVLQPEDFSEDQKQRLCRVLQLLSVRSFDHSLVLILTPREESSGFMEKYREEPALQDMIRLCRYRYVWRKNLTRLELLTRLGQTAEGAHRSCDVFEDEDVGLTMKVKPESSRSLNMVLCGRRGAVKTSAAKAISGQTELPSVSNSSECVKTQAEVCGRRLSLVELPALCGKPQEAVMEESFRCVSLCDPEGVHAFILVLPVGPLTDEDKAELQTIQNTFGSGVNDFTMILFSVESDPTAPAVVNFVRGNKEIQELRRSCGGRSVVLNIKDRQQIPELLEAVEKMRDEGTRCFTFGMLTKTQTEKFSKLEAEFQDVKQMLEERNEDESQTSEQLREALLKEMEKEMKTKEESLKKKQEEELKALQAEIQKERKLRVQQQKEKDECINKERERRKKEREEDERRWKKQEEAQRIDWKRKLDASDKKFHSQREQWESTEKKLEQCRREMKRDRDAWDKERCNIWERVHQELKQNLEEEKTSHRKLQEEYIWKRKKWTYSWFALLLLIVLFLLYYVFHTSQRVL